MGHISFKFRLNPTTSQSEKLSKIAGSCRFRQSSAKRIPRIVIAQFLRYASSAVIDILCFDLVPCAGTGIRGYAFHAVVVGCGDAMRIFLFSAPPFDAFRSETS